MRAGPLFVLSWTAASAFAWAVFFLLSFLIVGLGLGLVVDDVDALMETPTAFTLGLAFAFGLGGAAQGAAQAFLLRRIGVAAGARWVLGGAAGWATLGLLYGVLEPMLPRLANEVAHNVAGGLVAGAIQMGTLVAVSAKARYWPAILAGTFVLGGLLAWAVEASVGMEQGDLIPLVMVLLMAITGTSIVWMARDERPRPEPVEAPLSA